MLRLGLVAVVITAACGGSTRGTPGSGGEVDTVSEFNDARWAAMCESIFNCTTYGGFRELFGTEARCRDTFQGTRIAEFGINDLSQAVDAGHVVFVEENVQACLDAVRSCEFEWTGQFGDAECRLVFQGTRDEGSDCYRDEECSDGASCVVTNACPGVCGGSPADRQDCDEDSDCDGKSGPHFCDFGTFTCAAITVLPPADEGEECWRLDREESDAAPCASGLWCDGDGVLTPDDPLQPSEFRHGVCRSPIPAGDACDSADDVCVDGHGCPNETTCEPWEMVTKPGDPCGDTQFCDPFARLQCVDGACQLIGDGRQGSPCRHLDLSAYRACEPGLQCMVTEATSEPTTSGTPQSCLPPRAVGEACTSSLDCASETCGADHRCAERFCGNAEAQF